LHAKLPGLYLPRDYLAYNIKILCQKKAAIDLVIVFVYNIKLAISNNNIITIIIIDI
jgi:hypothetical protein